MKKLLILFLIFFSLVLTVHAEDTTQSESVNSKSTNISLAENAKSAIMLEASTGKIIFEKNDDTFNNYGEY